jgi:hypothetical protein
MPPVLGPVSPSPMRLWSWLVASASTCRAVGDDDEAGLLAGHEFLDHHARAVGVVLHAQRVGAQHVVDGGMRLGQRHRHHHALAGGQAVGLDDDGRALGVDIGVRLRRRR